MSASSCSSVDIASQGNKVTNTLLNGNVFPEHVERAERAIAAYSLVIGGAFDDSLPLLNSALSATYGAVCKLQQDHKALASFLDERRPGPKSANPVKPIVRKLWRSVPTRETIHRYASCIALARASHVKQKDFSDWLSKYPGGIKAAAGAWASSQRGEDARHEAVRRKIKERDQLLAKAEPMALPDELGSRSAGLYLSVIRVSQDGKAEHLVVLDSLSEDQVTAVIKRGCQ